MAKAPAAAGNLRRLTGVWVRQDTDGIGKGSFQLVRINPDSTGTFTFFRDNRRGLGRDFFKQHPDAPRYYLLDEPLKIRYRPQLDTTVTYVPNSEVQIWTGGFRLDYELSGDTLREVDKMGYQGSLVRIRRYAASR